MRVHALTTSACILRCLSTGYWGSPDLRERRTLASTTRWMAEYGYDCFLQAGAMHGHGATLAPISGPCWQPAFETRSWSNVLCAADTLALGLLHNLSWSGWRRRYRTRKSKSRSQKAS